MPLPLVMSSMQAWVSASAAEPNAPERTSVPRTRIVCGLASMNGLPSSVSPTPSASLPFWIWAETANASKLSTIQPSAPSRTHLPIRRHGGRVALRRGQRRRLLAAVVASADA